MQHFGSTSNILRYGQAFRFVSDVLSQRLLCASSISESEVLKTDSHDHHIQQNQNNAIQRRNDVFDATKKKKLSKLVPRIEKIEVQYQGRGISDNAVMYMNKHLSTPYHCAMHISRAVADSGVVAVVSPLKEDDKLMVLDKPVRKNELVLESLKKDEPTTSILWDMHKPLPWDCKLEVLKFNMENSSQWHHEQVNKAYWNSSAFVLGNVVQEAFKANYDIGLYNWPYISVNRGAFCYDIALDKSLKDWNVSQSDLVYFTKLARSIISKNSRFEQLDVSPQCALEMFDDDKHRCDRVGRILETYGNDTPIRLYRLDKHIDISSGPHIANTSVIYHYVITAIHTLYSKDDGSTIRRFQGVSLPKELRVHHSLWSMLESRAQKLVKQNIHFHNEANDLEKDALHESIENETKRYTLSYQQWREGDWKQTDHSFRPKIDTEPTKKE